MEGISVLISLYGKEDPLYFNLAIQSIWEKQTRKPDEIILIKDGPLTPALDELLHKWKTIIGDPLVIVPLEQNRGLPHALNTGLELCRYEYIARMDTDDICFPERFQMQSQYLDSHPQTAVLGTAIQEIDEEGNKMLLRTYPSSMKEIKKYIAKANPLAHSTVMMRKSLFQEGLRYDENYKKNQDLDLWFRVLAQGHIIANINTPLLYFRRTKDTYNKRRSFLSAYSEFRIFVRGVRELHGLFTWRYIYAAARLGMKLFPASFSEFVYKRFYKN